MILDTDDPSMCIYSNEKECRLNAFTINETQMHINSTYTWLGVTTNPLKNGRKLNKPKSDNTRVLSY